MRPPRRVALLMAGLPLLAAAVAGAVAAPSAQAATDAGRSTAPALTRPSATSPLAAAARPAYSATHTLSRVFTKADGTQQTVSSREVTVTADRTQDLRGRQRIRISWSGAQPSGGRAANPYGENGLLQEYPVMILQCRGVDDPTLPARKRLSPSTCWTGSVAERSQVARSQVESTWTKDLYADPADTERLSGMTPFPDAATCPTADIDPFATHLTPFVAASGAVFPACDSDHMPPEAAVNSAFPPNEIAAFTDTSGQGSVQFEVRSDVENESLGCNDTTPCSIVVVPIMGLSCAQPASPMSVADQACRKTGRFLPGSANGAGDGIDSAVGPALWWSASNWRGRFSIPITFGDPPDTCDVLDPRAPTGFYGTELLAQAALQWSPAYCLRKDRFKFQLNQMSDVAGFNLMESGEGAAAVVSSAHPQQGDDPVGYAPTAVTGFAVGYVIDRPENAGEYDRLRLNARLLAKLLTESYVGSDLGRGHPGMGENPVGIMNDPEFIALNPGLTDIGQEAGAALLNLSISSDVIGQLTDYVAHDQDAMDFIAGKPDPWGMRVNPSYKGIDVPREEWPLLDDYVPTTANTCRQDNPGVYLSQIAAPVSTLRAISTALLDSWPNIQTRCDKDLATGLYKLGRVDRQSYGARFMLGIVSLGDADRYGLRGAALETKPGHFVAPTQASMAAAVRLLEPGKADQPFTLDQTDVRRSTQAYPGTMVVYTAARLRNLDQDTADKVAQFIRVSTSEGQRPGSGNGQLPGGFLPITRTGATAALYRSAQSVADAVEAQIPLPTQDDGGDGTDTAGGTDVPSSDVPDLPAVDAGTPDTAPEAPAATPTAITPQAVAMPDTRRVSSRVGGGLLPGLLVLGLVGLVVSTGLRFLPRPPSGGAAR